MAKNKRTILFVIIDFVCFNASYLLAYLINARFVAESAENGGSVGDFFAAYAGGFLILILVKVLALYFIRVYKIWIEYAGLRDFQRIALAVITGSLAAVTAAALLQISPGLSPRIILFSLIFDLIFTLGVRYLYLGQVGDSLRGSENSGRSLRRRYAPKKVSKGRVMIVGTGQPAADLIAEMQTNESNFRKPEVIVEDEKGHGGDTLLDVEIAEGRAEIRLRARRQSIEEIIIAKPYTGKRQIAALLRECVKTRSRISMLPPARPASMDAQAPSFSLSDLKSPTVVDLLGRDMPRVDHREIGDQLKGRVVLVTGGAGVFGSELCRRIIQYRPRRLIALDIDEDGLALLSSALEEFKTDETEFRPVIASIREAGMIRRVFAAFRPHIVFHAAEIKQIPLAQTNPREAFLTNVLGLKTTCDLADEYAAEKFILCSTVRAAEPVNVLAQCKRTAEMYIAEKNEKSQTKFSSVRFPNLIESRGNVISIFENQIERGESLTVTDKDIGRRFMSAEEAALLTTRASSVAAGGEIFELGPGEAFGIRELAEAMIRLAGKIPYEDAEIVITQLRPGERIMEESAEPKRTGIQSVDRIWLIEDQNGIKLPHWSQIWCQDPERMDDAAVMDLLRLIFPTYKTKQTSATMRGVKIENE